MAPHRVRTEHRNISRDALLRIESATATAIGILATIVDSEEGEEQNGQDERVLSCGFFRHVFRSYSSIILFLTLCFVFFYISFGYRSFQDLYCFLCCSR
jgi:hypothetical protein